MTYIHLLNCLVLTFAPPFILYSASSLGENKCWTIVVSAVLMYVAAQFVKMILVATFVEVEKEAGFDLLHDLMRSSIGFVDIIGITIALVYDFFARHRLSQQDRISGCVLGWVLGESLLQRLFPLWVSARKSEFLWANVFVAVQSNIHLIFYLGYVSCVWLYGRRDLSKRTKTMVISLGFIFMFYPTLMSYLSTILSEAMKVGCEFVVSLGLCAVSYLLYQSYVTSKINPKLRR